MGQLSLEYQEAKASYKATAADGKENRCNRCLSEGEKGKMDATNAVDSGTNAVGSGLLRPKFDPLVTSKQPKQQKQRKSTAPRHLSSEYHTAKLKYKSSASRAKSSSGKERTPKQNDKAIRKRQPPRPATTSKQIVARDKPDTLANAPPPTAEDGLKLLGLLRPLDNNAYDFGLAKGIEVHLIESIKLCGLKKGREKSLLDMVTTLCNHLTNREAEITRWIEHSDTVALKSAEKLGQLVLSRDEAQNGKDVAHRALLAVRGEVLMLRKEFDKCREGMAEMLHSVPSAMRGFEDQLKQQLKDQRDRHRSECKSEICDTVDELTTAHDTDRERLEGVIGGLDRSLQAECERVKSLEEQLENAKEALAKAEEGHEKVQADMQADFDKASIELEAATERIKSLEELLENERNAKKVEIEALEKKMNAQLEEIDVKVKKSFNALVEKKNKEIERALARAEGAEASAKAAELLLSELKASLASKLKLSSTTAEATSES